MGAPVAKTKVDVDSVAIVGLIIKERIVSNFPQNLFLSRRHQVNLIERRTWSKLHTRTHRI